MSESSPASNGNETHHSLREQVEASFTAISQVVHAALAPLPTQTGDGSYIEEKVPTGLFKDLQKMGFKDVDTLVDMLKSNLSGEPVNDKTYLMERVIQVCPMNPQPFCCYTAISDHITLVCQRIATHFEEW